MKQERKIQPSQFIKTFLDFVENTKSDYNFRVTDIIRTRPKTAIFKSFRRFTLERRQPSCGFNPKNPIKIPRLRDEDFLQ